MEYKDFAEKINFTKLNNCYYFIKDNFVYYLKDYESFIKIKSFYVSLNEEIKTEHIKEFTNAAFENICYVVSSESKNDTLVITLPTSSKVNEGFINSCINILTSITLKLKELNYTPKTRCLHCHKEADLLTLHESYIPLHEECKEKIKEKYRAEIEKEKKEKYRYALNILFSLLIAFGGFIFNYLITYYFNVIITPLLLIITFGSFYGLHLSKAPNNKIAYIITFIISLNFIILFDILAFKHLSEVSELTINLYIQNNLWYFIRKTLFSLLFIFGGFRLYKMFFAKFHPNFVKLLKNI